MLNENRVTHYLYFSDENSAKCAGDALQEKGFAIAKIHFVDIGNLPWSLSVFQNMDPADYLNREEEFLLVLRTCAEHFGGEYDGHEIGLV